MTWPMDARERAALDRHITGNWGEDSVPGPACRECFVADQSEEEAEALEEEEGFEGWDICPRHAKEARDDARMMDAGL